MITHYKTVMYSSSTIIAVIIDGQGGSMDKDFNEYVKQPRVQECFQGKPFRKVYSWAVEAYLT